MPSWRLGHENREAKRKHLFVFKRFRVWRTQRHTRTQTSLKCAPTQDKNMRFLNSTLLLVSLHRGSWISAWLLLLIQRQWLQETVSKVGWWNQPSVYREGRCFQTIWGRIFCYLIRKKLFNLTKTEALRHFIFTSFWAWNNRSISKKP